MVASGLFTGSAHAEALVGDQVEVATEAARADTAEVARGSLIQLGFTPVHLVHDEVNDLLIVTGEGHVAAVAPNGEVRASRDFAESYVVTTTYAGAVFVTLPGAGQLQELRPGDLTTVWSVPLADPRPAGVAVSGGWVAVTHEVTPRRVTFVNRSTRTQLRDAIPGVKTPYGLAGLTSVAVLADPVADGFLVSVSGNETPRGVFLGRFEFRQGVPVQVAYRQVLNLVYGPLSPDRRSLSTSGMEIRLSDLARLGPAVTSGFATTPAKGGLIAGRSGIEGSSGKISTYPEGDIVQLVGNGERVRDAGFSNSGDEVFFIEDDQLRRFVYDPGPGITAVSEQIIDPRVTERIRVSGYGFGQLADVRIAGVSVPYIVEASDTLRVETPRQLPKGRDAHVVVVGTNGSSASFPIRITPLETGTPLYLRVTQVGNSSLGAVDYDFGLRCSAGGPLGEPPSLRLGAGDVRIIPMKPGSACELQRPLVLNLTSGFFDPENPSASVVDVLGRTTEVIVRWEPVGVHYIQEPHGVGQVIWLGVAGFGDVPAGTAFRIEQRCGSSSTIHTVRAPNSLRAHYKRSPECTYTLLDQHGGSNPRIVRRRTDPDALRVFPGTSLTETSAVALLWVLDWPPTPLQYPATVGSPTETVGGQKQAGRVHVLDLGADGHPTATGAKVLQSGSGLRGSPQPQDRLGTAVLVADFDGNGWSDIAVGVPGQDLPKRKDVGIVQVAYHDRNGLMRVQILRQRGRGDVSAPEPGDGFGSSMAITDLNADGWVDLAVGSPGEDVGDARNAGAVHVFYGGTNGLSKNANEVLYEGPNRVGGSAESGDRFGASLGGSGGRLLAVGVPGEDLRGVKNAGMVAVFRAERLRPARVTNLDSPNGLGAGDRFGSSLAVEAQTIYIGTPGYDDAGLINVGRVGVAESRITLDDGATAWLAGHVRRSTGPSDVAPQPGERFGSAVAVLPTGGEPLLAVGAPYRDVAGAADAGGVYLRQGTDDLMVTLDLVRRGWARAGDGLGSSVAFVGFGSTLLAGAPGRDVNGRTDAGAVLSISSTFALITQDTSGIPSIAGTGDGFGGSVGGRMDGVGTGNPPNGVLPTAHELLRFSAAEG